jgi:hypothetical protein
VIYSVRIELEVTVGRGEHVVSYADRLHARLREQEGGTIQRAGSLFHTRRGPHHGLARATVTIQGADQGRAVTTALKALRAATGDEAQAWNITRARIIVGPARSGWLGSANCPLGVAAHC